MIGIRNENKKLGYSLVEVIISVLIFVTLILSATQIFKLVIDGQRSAMASQNVQESLKYFLEVIVKEMRMAQRDDGNCVSVPDNEIFAITTNSLGDVLNFRNYYDECVTYSLADSSDTNRFKIIRDADYGFISPKKIYIDSLDFSLKDGGNTQPVMTIMIKAHALGSEKFESEMTIQTSIASRYYKN